MPAINNSKEKVRKDFIAEGRENTLEMRLINNNLGCLALDTEEKVGLSITEILLGR